MNELEIRKIAKEEFMSNVMNNIDSALIFAYIKNLEQKATNLQSKIDKAIELIEKEDLITYFRETKDLELANEFEDLYKNLKEDK